MFYMSLDYTSIVYTDASSIGVGGYIVEYNDKICHSFWTAEEMRMSSIWRELKAVSILL